MYRTPYTQYAPQLSSRTMPGYSATLPHRTGPTVVGPNQAGQGQGTPAGGQGAQAYLRQQQQQLQQASSPFSYSNPSALSNQAANGTGGLRGTAENVNDASQLDLNEFPALGATASNTTASGPHPTQSSGPREGLSSYASQAQHHPSSNQTGGPLGNGLNRDFTNPEEFPALGAGQSTAHESHLGPTAHQNGFQGQIGASGPISILRNNAFGGDDKRGYALNALKGATPTPSSWAQQQQAQQQAHHPQNGITQQQSLSQVQAQQPTQQVPQAGQDNASALDPTSTTNANQLVQPHTPADQVLHSAADRWGLLALVRALRQQTDDALSSGQDLGLLGMELDNPGSLYPKFATPWASYLTTTPQTEPNYHLPACYNVAPPPPNPKKAAQFSDETLFFSFYAMPRDAAQEIAAQELYNRNWRYHKVQRIWITMDSPQQPNQQQQQAALNAVDGSSICTVWDVDTWERQTRMMRIDMRDLENRDPPVGSAAATAAAAAAAGVVGNANLGVGAVGDRTQSVVAGLASQQQQQQGQLGAQAQGQVYQQQQQQQQLRA